MRNLYTKNEYLDIKKNEDILNEGLFSFLGNMFNKIKTMMKKVKGAQEVQNIYDEYLGIIDKEIKTKAQIDFGLSSKEQLDAVKAKETNKPVPQSSGTNQSSGTTEKVEKTSEKVIVNFRNRIFEAELNEEPVSDKIKNAASNVVNSVKDKISNTVDKVNTQENSNKQLDNIKSSSENLKKKSALIQQIVDKYEKLALNKMQRVLDKMGGRASNPKLAIIIDNKKDEFELAILNAKIKIFDASGDKNSSNKLIQLRNKLVKDLDAKWNKVGTATHVEIKVGEKTFKSNFPYRYESKNGIRSITINKAIEGDDKKINAAYISGESANKEQQFDVEKIQIEPKIEKDKTYEYFSKSDNKIVSVILVDSNIDDKGMVKVKKDNSEIKVYAGGLMELPENEKPINDSIKKENIKEGDKYMYTPNIKNDGTQPADVEITVVKKDGVEIVSDYKGKPYVTVKTDKSQFSADMSKLKKIK